jgi:hypothetical protein
MIGDDDGEPRGDGRLPLSARHAARETREALGVVRSVRRGKTRAELVALLEEERARRGLPKDPLAVEVGIDWLCADGRTRLHTIVSSLQFLTGTGSGDRPTPMSELKASLSGESVLAASDRFAPPEKACYLSRDLSEDWTAVVLDPDSEIHLAEAHAAAHPGAGDTAILPVWLAPGHSREGESRDIVVHIGAGHVGNLDREAIVRFASVMRSAEAEDQFPQIQARLTRRSERHPPFLMTVQLPPEV